MITRCAKFPQTPRTFCLTFLDIHDFCNLGVSPQRMWSITIHWEQTKHQKIREVSKGKILQNNISTGGQSELVSITHMSKAIGIQIHIQSNCNHSSTIDETATLTFGVPIHMNCHHKPDDPGRGGGQLSRMLSHMFGRLLNWAECSSASAQECRVQLSWWLRARPKLRFPSLSPSTHALTLS